MLCIFVRRVKSGGAAVGESSNYKKHEENKERKKYTKMACVQLVLNVHAGDNWRINDFRGIFVGQYSETSGRFYRTVL